MLTLVMAETAPAGFVTPDAGTVVARVSNPPDVVGIGASIRVADRIVNRGDSTAPATRVRYYLSRDARRNSGDQLLGSRPLGSLAPGESSRGSRSVALPRVRPGAYRLVACAGRSCRASAGTASVVRSRAPVVGFDTTEGGSNTFRPGEPPRPIAPNATVTDADDALMSGATVRIVAPEQGEQLFFQRQLGITGTYDSGTGVLTLKGQASTGAYQTALRSVSYSHSGDSPSNRRTLGVRVRDAVGVESTAVFTSIDVSVN